MFVHIRNAMPFYRSHNNLGHSDPKTTWIYTRLINTCHQDPIHTLNPIMNDIASIYKDRWEIELFFKKLKQHLKVKTFIGITENALRIQIWTALL